MKLSILESSTGVIRSFDANENMSVYFLIQKLADTFSYDKKRMKLLFNTTILNKMPLNS